MGNCLRRRLVGALIALVLLAALPATVRAANRCGEGEKLHWEQDGAYSFCVPDSWTMRMRGSEKVWSPKQGLDLVFAFRIKTPEPKDVSAPLVTFFKKKGATLHVSPSGALKYHLDGVDGIGKVLHHHRYGLLIYTQCAGAGKECSSLIMKGIEIADTVQFDGLADTVVYDKWERKEAKGVIALAPPGSAAAKELERLAWTYAAGQAKILDTLGIEAGKQPIKCFFYPSNEEIYKYTRRSFGFHIGDAQEVHSFFASRSDRQSTGHEMTHSITHRAWGEPAEALLGEGIAVAMDLSGVDHHARARKAIADKEPGFKLTEMLGQSWWQHDMEVSYAVSGSFVTFLLKTGNVAKVRKLYQAKDLPAALKKQYGWSMQEAEQKWRQAAGLTE